MDQGNRVITELMADERIEGESVTGDLDVLSLGMTDDEIANAIGNRVTQAEKFWNDKLSLDQVREKVEKYWLNSYMDEDSLYNFQVPYKDPRIFVAIETLVALATSRPPQPLITQAYDTEASYELAQQLQKFLLSKYEDLYIKQKLQMVARHLLVGYRLAVMKVGWDATVGAMQPDGTRFGELDVQTLRPQRVVIDAGAQKKNDIPLIAEYRSEMLEDLCEMFPEKKNEILAEHGITAGTAIDMTKRVGYLEVHFTTREKESRKKIEAIAWKYGKVVMGSTKTPFWNYEETYIDEQGNTRRSNFLPKPQKPYIFFNFLNLGKWIMDDISLTEQAATLQDIHDKRGRQIVENADHANGGWVFNTKMVNPEAAAAWLNNPGDKILAAGNVGEAAARLPAPPLPDYVVEDKLDARNEIDNIFGTHGAIKGEVTANKTLGQDVMSQRGDAARLNVLATAEEDGADGLYKYMTQVTKVLYDEPQLVRYSPDDEQTDFFTYGRDKIEDGIAVRVRSGSVLPEDPIAKKQDTKEMMAILDPLTIAKGLNEPNPKEWAKRNFLYRVLPDRYMTEYLGMTPEQGSMDPSAMQHIQLLSKGQEVPPEASPTKEHLATHQAFIESPDFKNLPPEIQQLHKIHIEAELTAAKGQMGMTGDKPGTPPSMQNAGNPGTPPPAAGNPGNAGTPPQQPLQSLTQPLPRRVV